MHWLTEMLHKYPELAVFAALGIGYWIGNFRIAGFSFGGVTGSLLAGIFVGWLFEVPVSGPAFHGVDGGAMGMGVGIFCGAFGLGGATPIASLSRSLLQQPMRFSIGSAYLAAFCISLVGTAFYAAHGQIEVGYAALVSAGCGLGVYLSTRAISRIPDRILEVLMLTTMVAKALFTLFDSWRAL